MIDLEIEISKTEREALNRVVAKYASEQKGEIFTLPEIVKMIQSQNNDNCYRQIFR